MKLSQILERGAIRFGINPCVAYFAPENELPPLVLTYRDAWQLLLQHETWVERVVSTSGVNLVVAYLSQNSIDMLLSMLACMNQMRNDVQVALLNTRWTPSEMAQALQTGDSSAKTLVLYSSGYKESAQATSDLLAHASWTLEIPTYSNLLFTRLSSVATTESYTEYQGVNGLDVNGAIQRVIRADGGNEDAVVVFTSGTTSGSKGVRLSHKSLWLQALAKLQPPCGYDGQTRMLASTVPLFHVGGLSSTLSVLIAGGTWIFPSTRTAGFDPQSVLQSISMSSQLSANTLVVVPAMLHSLLEQVSQNESFESVRLILIGGQSASPPLLRDLAHVFSKARFVQTFACTEAASSLTFHEIDTNNLEATTTLALPDNGPTGDCVGVPPPQVKLALMATKDDHGENDVTLVTEPYKIGVFATRGNHVMNGYWKRGGRNNHIRRPHDDWYLTNDLGFRDSEGRFYFCGRTTDVIRTGGETVLASEVERILLSHPDIRECAIFALPDDRFGETVCAALVCPRDKDLTLSRVRIFCAERGLAGYKRPRVVHVVKELPRNSSGKIVKYRLVERFRERQALQSRL